MMLSEFATAIEVLQVGTGKTLSNKEITVWFRCLQDLSLESLHAAITRYLCEGDDWPSIAKIRKLAASAVHGECLTHGEAFDRMLWAIRQFGFYKEESARKHLDDLTWRTVRGLGGWEAICDSPIDQRATLRAQFRMVYEGLAEREEKHRALPESLRPRIENPKSKVVDNAKQPALPEVVKKLSEAFDAEVERLEMSDHDDNLHKV